MPRKTRKGYTHFGIAQADSGASTHISGETPDHVKLYSARGRSGIGKGLLAIIIVLVLVGVAAAALYANGPMGASSSSIAPSSSSASSTGATTGSQSSSGSTGGTSSSGGLNITNMYADVLGAGLQAPISNSTSIFDRGTYTAATGLTFTVDVDIVYSLCAGRCPTQIIAVVPEPSGFTVESTSPDMPVPVQGTVGVQQECHFIVTLQAPSTPYTGPLTLYLQAG